MTECNARFWVYLNGGPVKLTLRPGQRRSWCTFRWTDEGWDSEWITWEHQGDRVQRCWESDGTDCDGRLRQGGESYVLLTELKGREFEGLAWPIWRAADRWQRDYAAEAAGY